MPVVTKRMSYPDFLRFIAKVRRLEERIGHKINVSSESVDHGRAVIVKYVQPAQIKNNYKQLTLI